MSKQVSYGNANALQFETVTLILNREVCNGRYNILLKIIHAEPVLKFNGFFNFKFEWSLFLKLESWMNFLEQPMHNCPDAVKPV